MINEQFDDYVDEAFASLPEPTREKMHNVAIVVEDCPTEEQISKLGLNMGDSLFGLFEGFAQSKRLNFGAVLPDKITIFRKAILRYCSTEEEVKAKIDNTLKHEIAHHFGSGEKGARKASANN
ncbi:MAG: metallopeptidase family protein [Patescibacteria group bacterium]